MYEPPGVGMIEGGAKVPPSPECHGNLLSAIRCQGNFCKTRSVRVEGGGFKNTCSHSY